MVNCKGDLIMGQYTEKSKELFLQGYNCAQAIAGGFSEAVGLNFETAIQIASSFGGGMGGMREVCGALTGAFVILGVKYGYLSPTDAGAKANHYKLISNVGEKFKEKWDSILCRDLMKKLLDEKDAILGGKPEEYTKRPCLIIVEDVAKILEEILSKTAKEKPK